MRAYYHKSFKKAYKKLSQKLKARSNERILLFLDDPYHPILNNHPLSGKYNGCRSINVSGDLRAIYKLIEDDLAYFIEIGTHGKLYK